MEKTIDSLKSGDRFSGVCYCISINSAIAKNGREYYNLSLQDRTGIIDAKVWEPQNTSVALVSAKSFVYSDGNVTVFNGANQLNIRSIKPADPGSYDPCDYFPSTEKSIPQMEGQLYEIIKSVKNIYLRQLLEKIFVPGSAFMESFKSHSAAKSVHHSFIGGLLEHTLGVTKTAIAAAALYPVLNRDLLVSGALLHDIGKVVELSSFPDNDYTDCGQLVGHIVLGAMTVESKIRQIDNFPDRLKNEIIHLILSHHGELEFGSPKKPALIEAIVLSFADNLDAKIEVASEALKSKPAMNPDGWIGFQKFLDSNLRQTSPSSAE